MLTVHIAFGNITVPMQQLTSIIIQHAAASNYSVYASGITYENQVNYAEGQNTKTVAPNSTNTYTADLYSSNQYNRLLFKEYLQGVTVTTPYNQTFFDVEIPVVGVSTIGVNVTLAGDPVADGTYVVLLSDNITQISVTVSNGGFYIEVPYGLSPNVLKDQQGNILGDFEYAANVVNYNGQPYNESFMFGYNNSINVAFYIRDTEARSSTNLAYAGLLDGVPMRASGAGESPVLIGNLQAGTYNVKITSTNADASSATLGGVANGQNITITSADITVFLPSEGDYVIKLGVIGGI